MERRPWLDRVGAELARRGVPARVRRRLLAELRDHLTDLTDEGLDVANNDLLEARLGPPDELATAAAAVYRRAGWVTRHPLLVFGLAPVPALVLGLAVTILGLELALGGAAYLCGVDLDNPPRAVAVALVTALNYAVRFLPFVLLTVLFTRLYARSRVRRRWYAVAAGQVLVLAGTFMSVIVLNDEPGKSQWMMGFAWMYPDAGGLPLMGWAQAGQVLAVAAAGWVMIRAARRREMMLA